MRLLTLGLGLQDGATTPAFDVGAEDCMQVLTSAQQELLPSEPSLQPLFFLHCPCFDLACGLVPGRTSVTTQDCLTHCSMTTAPLVVSVVICFT